MSSFRSTIYLLALTASLAYNQTGSNGTGSDQASKERDLHLHDLKHHNALNPKDLAVPRSYALVIGISKYQNLPKEGQLDFPDADADGVYTSLINSETGRFPAENVHRLLGAKATFENMRHELEEWLPSVTKEDDRVVIYFAGHGLVWHGRAYLAPYDVAKNDIPGTAYSMERLGQVFGGKIKAKWRVLLTDACHSGAIIPSTDPQALNQSLLWNDLAVFSLTASRDREVSVEGRGWGGGHGVFTYFVMKGLDGQADENRDGVVTADELAEYVRVNVREATKGAQNPMLGGSFPPDMLLAFNPFYDPSKVAAVPRFGKLVIEANMDNTQVFLDGNSQGVVNKGKALELPGITPGVHMIKAVHLGYEPYGPEEQTVSPGQVTTVSVRITIARPLNKASLDLFEKGLKHYTDGNAGNYQKAAELFQQALQMDPRYSRAALYLGRTYSALRDMPKADQYFKMAVDIDPDYLEARDSYAGTLLDEGKFESAIRQLNSVIQLNPSDGMARYMLCVAFTRLGATDQQATNAYQQATEQGFESVRLLPGKGEAHFWLAEALRRGGRWQEAEPEYQQYLKLSSFDSGMGGKINYWVLGTLIGMGKKTRASQHDIWIDQRSLAYFGLCDCERLLKHLDNAITYCQTSLNYDPQDPFSHYSLGESFVKKSNVQPNAGDLIAARKHFSAVIAYNADTEEAARARRNIGKIDATLPRLQ